MSSKREALSMVVWRQLIYSQSRVSCIAASIFSLSPPSSLSSATPKPFWLQSWPVGLAFSTELFCLLHYAIKLSPRQEALLVDDLFGSLSLKDSGSWIVLWDSGRPPPSTKACRFSCSVPLSRRHFSTRSMELQSSPCKTPALQP